MQNLSYKIVIVGEVSSGKSSFINSLMGKYVCPTSILRKTIHTSSHFLEKYNDLKNVTEVVELVDHPGFNDANHNTFLQQFLENISTYDHIIWVTTAEKCLMNETEKKTFYTICDQINFISKLIDVTIVVNKSDMNDSRQNVFRLEKNEYEILYDNMANSLAEDYPFVKIFKHSSYYTFLQNIIDEVFELDSQYVDEFNRAIRAKHGPQQYSFKKGDIIRYSDLLDNEDFQMSGPNIPNLVEPYLFDRARTSRLDNFKKMIDSRHSMGITRELEFVYDALLHELYKTDKDDDLDPEKLLETIKKRMTENNLQVRDQNNSVSAYITENDLNFSKILEKVLDRQSNQIDFLNVLAGIMGEILYCLVNISVYRKLNFRNSGKSEFLYFLFQMDRMTLTPYDEEDYFGILDTIKTESKKVQFSKFDPKSGAIVPKEISRFIVSGGEIQLNMLLWGKLLKVEGRFSVIKNIIDTVANNSFVLTNAKLSNHLFNAPNRFEIAQKKLIWKKHKSELDRLPKFLYDNVKFWYFNLLQIYLPSLFNPRFLEYTITNAPEKNNINSAFPNFPDLLV